MKDKAIAYDLGTSGIKASLFDPSGESIADSLVTYDTVYKGKTFQEQDPRAWWDGVVACTHKLLRNARVDAGEIAALAISGHSLGAVPVSKDGRILTERTPLWSDLRAKAQADRFFERVDYRNWYMTTGNGFPRECYSIFKILWCRENQPDVYAAAHRFLGSKDLCNYFLTGRMCTDPSYASGSGVYSLKDGAYSEELIAASGVDRDKLPEIIGSQEVVGHLTHETASLLGLKEDVLVVSGGVDNACMALGAKGFRNNRAYMSLGSSAWIAVVSDEPILDFERKPFVFAHVIPGMYASATSVFAAGTSMRWARENLCPDLVLQEKEGAIRDAYAVMDEWVQRSPVGANRLLFNPSLAGGAMIEESPHICGGFVGLNAGHNRQDLLRAVMEGITYNLRYALEVLTSYGQHLEQLLIVGGGSKSAVWRQMFADVMRLPVLKTSIDQNAASLGAAALAFAGAGIWKDFSRIDQVHRLESVLTPDMARAEQYEPMYGAFRKVAHHMAEIGQMLDFL